MSNRSIEHSLNQQHQLCFVHLPKTAGTTLTSILDAQFDRHEICPINYWTDLAQQSPQDLAQYRFFRGHFPYEVSRLLNQQALYLTVLRDPIERVISGYEFMKTCTPTRPQAIITQQKALSLSLKEFVCDPEASGVINSQTLQLAGREAFPTLPAPTDPIWLEVAQQNLSRFALIGLTERFQETIALITYCFGWKPLVEFQNLMVTKRRPRKDELAQDVIDAIAERNQLDLALYQYAKDLFQTNYDQMLHNLAERYVDSSADLSPAPNSSALTDSRELYRCLERHYITRCTEAAPVLKSSILFGFDQAIAGSGWHTREGMDREAIFRWTGPGTVSTLDFYLSRDQDLILECRMINMITLEVLSSLTLQVNEHPVPWFTLYHEDTTTLIQAILPQSILISDTPFTRLTLQVNLTTSPNQIDGDNPDTRRVGLAIDLIHIYPSVEPLTAVTSDFLFHSSPWSEVATFLKEHLAAGQKLIAPKVFSALFKASMPPLAPEQAGRLDNYYLTALPLSDVDWIVYHKGMQREIGSLLRSMFRLGFAPVFANSVFTIFAKHPQQPSLNYFARHVRSVYTRYLRFYLKQKFPFLARLSVPELKNS
jgi:hypothetical protein